MNTQQSIHSNLAIPPGEYLQEVLTELGMTHIELAHHLGRSASELIPLLTGEEAITSDTALLLEEILPVPAHIWTGLEDEYRLARLRRAKNGLGP